MKGKIVKGIITGVVVYRLCDLFYQMGKAQMVGFAIKHELIEPFTEDQKKDLKLYPGKFVLGLANILAKEEK